MKRYVVIGWHTLVGVSMLLGNSGSGLAQASCDSVLQSLALADASGYGRRDGDERCEGLYRSPIAEEGNLEVVSFVIGSLTFDPAKTEALLISVPPLRSNPPDEVRVRATPLPLKTFYRMDATVRPGASFRWPTNVALRPAGLNGMRVGVLGWRGEGDEQVLVPLIVVPEGESPAAGAAAQLVLRATGFFDQVLWRVRTDASAAALAWQELVPGGLVPGQTAPLALPPGDRPILRIEFAAKRRDSDDWLTPAISVARPT